MKTKNDQQPTQYAIPAGEGLNALPSVFNNVVAMSTFYDGVIPELTGDCLFHNPRFVFAPQGAFVAPLSAIEI